VRAAHLQVTDQKCHAQFRHGTLRIVKAFEALKDTANHQQLFTDDKQTLEPRDGRPAA
jgi:hypothetical protein